MRSIWSLILLGSLITYHCLTTVSGEEAKQSTDASHPTFESCKPYVDAALKTGGPEEGDDESGEGGTAEQTSVEDGEPPDDPDSGEEGSKEEDQNDSTSDDDSKEGDADGDTKEEDDDDETKDSTENDNDANASEEDANNDSKGDVKEGENASDEDENDDKTPENDLSNEEDASELDADGDSNEEDVSNEEGDGDSKEDDATKEDGDGDSKEEDATKEDDDGSKEEDATKEDDGNSKEEDVTKEDGDDDSKEGDSTEDKQDDEAVSVEDTKEESQEDNDASTEDGEKASTEAADGESSKQGDTKEEDDDGKSEEDDKSTDGDTQEDSGEEAQSDGSVRSDVADQADQSQSGESEEDQATQEDQASDEDANASQTETAVSEEEQSSAEGDSAAVADSAEGSEEADDNSEEEKAEPYEPRSREHITQILGLDDSEQTKTTFTLLDKVTQTTLKELKSTYEGAIKPLEQLYKYRDLSNRHFGDPEIFSKPLIVFMGPWSGGKSTIINWLLGIQHEDNALRTGADPSPAQFNIMMYGKEPEKLDGTQLAADWTFSGLQKFGQSFLDRLRGQKLPNRLLEKVNIVEIPGILEVRKQVERSFPFNDACQWFIDRADTLFLIYDPAKLDIGPETEAILDQLKGRENQVRIVLNKADTVKPDELLRVQAMLVWNISPLMSSAEPPIMYAASLWDRPLQVESPKSLLVAHENNFLKDIRDGIERRVETRIAAARRFAVRVRNHAKMADCYLNTYNNHRSFFSDRKKVSSDIIDHPQNYHIYEGLSTLTNISRYDLPDPDTYRDFFRLNPLWDFPTLQSTCSFWRGCPLHKLDIAIAYDLPEILGKFRRQREAIVTAKISSKN